MDTIILAGGSGTRLWPLSRELFPKQFIPLIDSKSLFQLAVERALLLSLPNRIFVVTSEKQKFIAEEQAGEYGIPRENILAEPAPKNTLPAICYAVLEKELERFAVLPSDHLIAGNEDYVKAFRDAEKLAEGHLITFGVTPTKPHTGYGYIKPGREINGGFEVKEFVEKPDIVKAKVYVADGYLWNSGMFLFDSKLFIHECKKHSPEVLEVLEEKGIRGYPELPEISIDYGLMEKTDKAAVVPLPSTVLWNDVGSFDAIYEVMDKNGSKNAVKGEAITLDAFNNLIYSERFVAAVGVSDMIIVDTRDALLVCPRNKTQRVKEVVKILKKRGDKRAEMHRVVYRPWGSFTKLERSKGYRINRLTVLPGRHMQTQIHFHRSEHWVVVRGTARVKIEGKEFMLKSGESTFVPSGIKHKLENPGRIPLEVIEVQIGELISDEDIMWSDE